MFDFLSYVRDSGMEIKLLPPGEGMLIRLEVRDPRTGYYERREITDEEARKAANIDKYTGKVLDTMLAKIGKRIATRYANTHKSRQMREREEFFRGK